MEEKVVGGKPVPIIEKRFVVSFRKKGDQLCTGSLITSKNVLLAARCILDFLIHEIIPKFEDYSIVAGSFRMFGETEEDIEEIGVTSEYNFSEESSFDIAMITVNHYYLYIIEESQYLIIAS